MKAIQVIIMAAFLIVSTTAFAQDGETDNREEMRLGFKTGLNFSNVYDEKTDEFSADSKFGFVVGAVLSMPINKYFGVQPEILLSQKGFKGKGIILGSAYTFTRTTTYIDIPIQIAFKPSEFVTFIIGPQYSYLIKQKDVFNSTFINTTHEEEFENENIRKNILGAIGGADINIKHLVIGARMGWDITNNNGDGSSNTPRYKNTWLQGTIGYTF